MHDNVLFVCYPKKYTQQLNKTKALEIQLLILLQPRTSSLSMKDSFTDSRVLR